MTIFLCCYICSLLDNLWILFIININCLPYVLEIKFSNLLFVYCVYGIFCYAFFLLSKKMCVRNNFLIPRVLRISPWLRSSPPPLECTCSFLDFPHINIYFGSFYSIFWMYLCKHHQRLQTLIFLKRKNWNNTPEHIRNYKATIKMKKKKPFPLPIFIYYKHFIAIALSFAHYLSPYTDIYIYIYIHTLL